MKESVGRILKIAGIVVGAVVVARGRRGAPRRLRQAARQEHRPQAARADGPLRPSRLFALPLPRFRRRSRAQPGGSLSEGRAVSCPVSKRRDRSGSSSGASSRPSNRSRSTGASFRLEQKAVSEEPFDAEALLLQASDTLAWAKRISLTGARLSITLLAREVSLENLDSRWSPTAAGIPSPTPSAAPTSRPGNGPGPSPVVSGLVSSGTLRLISPFGVDSTFDFRSPRVSSGGIEDRTRRPDDRPGGPARQVRRRIRRVPARRSASPASSTSTGRPPAGSATASSSKTEARAGFESLERAAALLGPRLPAASAPPVSGAGPSFRGSTASTARARRRRTDLDATLALQGVEFDAALDGRPLHVNADGRIDASGPSRDPASRPTSARPSAKSPSPASPSPAPTSASRLRRTRSAVDVAGLDARLSGLAYDAAEGRTVSFDTVTLAAKGTLDLAGRSADVTSLEARLPGLAPLRLSGRLGFGKRAIDAAPARGPRARRRGPPDEPPRRSSRPDWPAGTWPRTADLSLDVPRGAAWAGDWSVSGTASLSGATFNDPSFTIAGEGLDSAPPVRGRRLRREWPFVHGLPRHRPGRVAVEGRSMSPGASTLSSSRLGGRYDPGAGRIDGLAVRGRLPGIGTVDAAGSAEASVPAPVVRPADRSGPEPRAALFPLLPGRRLRGETG